MNTALDETIDTLNAYFRSERSAVDTYGRALHAAQQLELTAALEEARASHSIRAERLRDRILELGGEPSNEPGPWALLATDAGNGVPLPSPSIAISAIEEFEYQDLKRYRDELAKLDERTRLLVLAHVLPAQELTYRRIKQLRRTFG